MDAQNSLAAFGKETCSVGVSHGYSSRGGLQFSHACKRFAKAATTHTDERWLEKQAEKHAQNCVSEVTPVIAFINRMFSESWLWRTPLCLA